MLEVDAEMDLPFGVSKSHGEEQRVIEAKRIVKKCVFEDLKKLR